MTPRRSKETTNRAINRGSMHIKELRIFGFKRFRSATIKLAKGMTIIVGDNDAGKTTILEALVAVTNGNYRGTPLCRCLSESLFNAGAVRRYVKSVRAGENCTPPEIVIEAVFDGSEDTLAPYTGDFNTTGREEPGIALCIALDQQFYEQYRKYLASKICCGVPVEYYTCTWTSFANTALRLAAFKYRSTLIESAKASYWPGSKAYVARITRDVLNKSDQIAIAQVHRCMLDGFSHDETVVEINKKITANTESLIQKTISFGFEAQTLDSWEAGVVTMLGGIPFSNAGDGTKGIVCTELALSRSKEQGKNIVLLEEPENHLSHTRLNVFLDRIKDRYRGTQLVVTTHSSFVANKLELKNLILLNDNRSISLNDLAPETSRFFAKAPGYKTLRIILCKVALLVEGDADELVVQRAYMDMHEGDLPIQNGIDVISVGTSFLRFLEVAEAIDKPAVALTDNDGDIAARKRKYADYKHVSVLMAEDNMDRQAVSYPERVLPSGKEKGVNYNTLESEIYESANKKVLEKILERDVSDRDATLKHMENNKTETALKIFDSEFPIDYPPYIVKAIEWADKQIEEVEED